MEFPKEKMDAALFDRELDAKGMNCPLPILKTKKALFEMDSGQVLRVLATDPGATGDFEAFARQTGNALISSLRNDDGVFVFHFRRK